MIQTSGILLCITWKQVYEDTRDFAVYKNADMSLCSKISGFFSAILKPSAIKDDL